MSELQFNFRGETVPKHVINQTHDDGVKLATPSLWCGRKHDNVSWAFLDAAHVASAVGGSVQPCKSCIKAIIKELAKEL